MTIIGVVVALLVGATVWSWILQHRKSKARAPRSKAKWLRHFRRPSIRPRLGLGMDRAGRPAPVIASNRNSRVSGR
jgi:hypothetical protein